MAINFQQTFATACEILPPRPNIYR